MPRYTRLLLASLVVLAVPAAFGEVHCPRDVESLRLRLVQSSLIILAIEINHSGPYDFVVDTGAQVTTIESSLAAELGLKSRGTTGVSGVGTYARAGYAYLDLIEAGKHSVANAISVIQDIPQLKSADPRIRGILGANFIEHFDVLIDNNQKIICMDESGALAAAFKGEHIELVEPQGAQIDLPFTRPITIPARLGALRNKPVVLRLDSGSNVPILYAIEPGVQEESESQRPPLMRLVNGRKQSFAILPAQKVEIGKQWLRDVSFARPINDVGAGSQKRENGVLPTIAFKRVFISCSGGYVSLESW